MKLVCRRRERLYRDGPSYLKDLAAAAAALGRTDEAQRCVTQCVARWPAIRLEELAPIYLPGLMRREDRQ